MKPVTIVGVLNVTPDSYFDGGLYNSVGQAEGRAGALLQEGADILDIGGESTGPGSQEVSLQEELARVIPVIEGIVKIYPDAKISVDTYKAEVARQAIAAGAFMINDITAGRGDSDMLSVIADANVHYVMMYAKDDSARTTVQSMEYEDVIGSISQFLEERISAAETAGISRNRIIVDPGMGHFISSNATYSLEVLGRLQELQQLQCSIYVSPSRKSFLAGSEELSPKDRLPATLAASAIAVQNGATYIRTHDVLEVRRACEITQSIQKTL